MIDGANDIARYLLLISPMCRFERSVRFHAERLVRYEPSPGDVIKKLLRVSRAYERCRLKNHIKFAMALCRYSRKVADCPARFGSRNIFVLRKGREVVEA